MKQLIFLATMITSTSALASSHYVTCTEKESDKACVQRAVKASDAMNQNFYTGKVSERPMIFNAIFSNKPATTLLQKFGEGGTVFETYLLVYPVEASEFSGLRAATFSAILEKQLEDVPPKPRVVFRAVDVSSIKILTGASEETE